jgi:hypothetical protein
MELSMKGDRVEAVVDTGQGSALQREPMRTGEEADEVRCGVDGPTIDQLHGGTSFTAES